MTWTRLSMDQEDGVIQEDRARGLAREVWQISDFVFDAESHGLSGAEGSIHLEPRTSSVLLDLVRHAGQVRSRDALLSVVWDDAFVGEAALTHCIWELRKAFGDDARNPQFIRTVPRRGYCLIADVARARSKRLGTLLFVDGVGGNPDVESGDRAAAASVSGEGLPLSSTSGRLSFFDRPADAVRRALAVREAEGGSAARIAVHMGEFELRGAAEQDRPPSIDPDSEAQMTALGQAARPGQILLGLGAFDMARRTIAASADVGGDGGGVDLRWSALGPFAIEGFERPVELFEVSRADRPGLGAPRQSGRVRKLADESTILGWRPGPGVAVEQRPNWVLVEKLGEGGFGEVWLSEHRKTRDQRVFKFCFEAERLRALKREVTLLRLLKESLGERDDIVHLLDWNFERPPYFLELEHTSAGSLESWAESRGGLLAIPLAARLELVARTADALAAAHSVGVLHKDVKPANILVHVGHGGEEQVRLGDFGIGHILDPARLENAGITVLGLTRFEGADSSSRGTRLYMAPETLEGREASTEADVYALGVVLFQVTSGAFDRAVAEGWQRQIDDPILVEDIAQCLDHSPTRRPSARELAERLRTLGSRRDEQLRAERERQEAEANRRALSVSQQRRRLWLGAALLASAFALVVSILAVQALRARSAAEASRLQAENLVNYMLGDLRQELAGVGRLDAMEGTLEKVLEYLDSVDPSDLDDGDLERRAEALRQVGEVRIQQGDWDAASAVFEAAVQLEGQRLERDSESPERRASFADSRYWLGFVDHERGELDRAHAAYEAHRTAYADLVAAQPENPDWQLELAYGHHNVAGIALQKGDLEGALADFRISRQLLGDLAESGDDPGLLLDLADSHNRIGLIEQRRGKLGEALRSFREEHRLVRLLAAASPTDTRLQERLATSGTYLANQHVAMGHPAAALEVARESVAIRRRLVALEPENAEWRRYLANELRWLGTARLEMGSAAEAEQALVEARDQLESLESGQQKNTSVRRMLGEVSRELAKSHRESGDRPAAERALERSLAILEDLVATHPGNGAAAASLAWAYLLRGDWRAESDPESAGRAWRRAADVLSGLAETKGDPTLLAPLAIAHLRLGELARAEPIVEGLRSGGYRSTALLEASRRAGLE